MGNTPNTPIPPTGQPMADLPPFPPDPAAPQIRPRRRKIVIRFTGYFFGSLILCFLVVHYGRVFGPKAWGSLRLVNTVVNLTPTLLSILFAFVVDKDLADRMRWRWLFRGLVVSIGVCLSLLLWHQQALSDIQSSKQIDDAVTKAVTDANKHSDTQFQAVQQNVGGVDKKVSAVGDSLTQTATALSTDIQKTSDAIQKTSDRLDTSIGKVGKPDPPPPATLIITLWDTNASAENPVLRQTVQLDGDGNYPVDFTIINSSQSAADSVDFWIQLCRTCSFAKEPDGFEKPPGSDELTRHRQINLLNTGVNMGKISILVKSMATDGFFQVAFHYSCKTCGGKISPNQIVTIMEAPAVAATPQ